MKKIALSEIKDNLPRLLREAASGQIIITRHGRPAGILVGFDSEDDWFDYRLEHDPGFLDRIASARASIHAGHGVHLKDLDAVLKQAEAPDHAPHETGSPITKVAAHRPPSSRATIRRPARSARR